MNEQLAQLLKPVTDKIPPQVKEHYFTVRDSLRPMMDEVRPYIKKAQPFIGMFKDRFGHLVQVRRLGQVGDVFRSLCVVGLNRSELLLGGEKTPVFADSWQELVDESLRRGMALMFFAPRGTDGRPVDPYLFLTGEIAGSGDEVADANMQAMAAQQLGALPLIDLCRMAPATPNTINILIAADVLFHWDVKDNYVLPTAAATWVRDLDSVLKSYPRTTRANVYTAWETDLLQANDRITVRGLRELPLDPNTWLNRPTFQEQYGTLIMVLGLMMVATAWGILTLNGRRIDDMNEQLRVVEQQIPRGGKFADLERVVTEQERMMQKRELFYLAVKDTSRAIELSNFKAESFEVKNTDADTPPEQLLVTLEAKRDAYNGWLQEEPAAKGFVLNSALVAAVRKQPSALYKLEGLIPLNAAWRDYQKIAARQPGKAAVGRTTPAPDAASLPATTTDKPAGKTGTASPDRSEGGAQ
ncbi:MAG TPA: hypothetical protein VHP58_04805 [Alphaproteobacteria bacterium]|nr:hypothetical protein [Alphaproteobacteria bacterium]